MRSLKHPTLKYRFVVATNPNQFKNRDEMRQNRKHVMYTFIDSKRRKSFSNNIPVYENGPSDEREVLQPDDSRLNATANQVSSKTFTIDGSIRQPFAPSILSSDHTSETSNSKRPMRLFSANEAAAKSSRENPGARPASKGRKLDPEKQDYDPLVRRPTNLKKSIYLNTCADEVPFPSQPLGGRLNPFDTWPDLSNPSLSIEKLKWSCKQSPSNRPLH